MLLVGAAYSYFNKGVSIRYVPSEIRNKVHVTQLVLMLKYQIHECVTDICSDMRSVYKYLLYPRIYETC